MIRIWQAAWVAVVGLGFSLVVVGCTPTAKPDMTKSDKMEGEKKDKMATGTMVTDKMTADKMATDKMTAGTMATDKMTTGTMATDNMVTDKMATDKMEKK